MKFGVAEGHLGSLGHTKFHANRCTGAGERGHPKVENSHFLLKSRPPGANPLTNF